MLNIKTFAEICCKLHNFFIAAICERIVTRREKLDLSCLYKPVDNLFQVFKSADLRVSLCLKDVTSCAFRFTTDLKQSWKHYHCTEWKVNPPLKCYSFMIAFIVSTNGLSSNQTSESGSAPPGSFDSVVRTGGQDGGGMFVIHGDSIRQD